MRQVVVTYRVRAQYWTPEYSIALIRDTDTLQQTILVHADGYAATMTEWDKDHTLTDLDGRTHNPTAPNVTAINEAIDTLDKKAQVWAKQQEL
jgi:hypothetical protein